MGAKSLLAVVKSLLVVVKSLLVVAKATLATQVATVLVAKIVDADSWRNFSLRKATAMDASQHAVAKSQHAVASQLAVASQAAELATKPAPKRFVPDVISIDPQTC